MYYAQSANVFCAGIECQIFGSFQLVLYVCRWPVYLEADVEVWGSVLPWICAALLQVCHHGSQRTGRNIFLARRVSGCLFGHPNPWKEPLSTPKSFCVELLKNLNLKLIIEFVHLLIIPIALFNDGHAMMNFYMFMVEIWVYCDPP